MILGVILSLLAAGTWIFFNAGQITKQDVSSKTGLISSAEVEKTIDKKRREYRDVARSFLVEKESYEHLLSKRKEIDHVVQEIRKKIWIAVDKHLEEQEVENFSPRVIGFKLRYLDDEFFSLPYYIVYSTPDNIDDIADGLLNIGPGFLLRKGSLSEQEIDVRIPNNYNGQDFERVLTSALQQLDLRDKVQEIGKLSKEMSSTFLEEQERIVRQYTTDVEKLRILRFEISELERGLEVIKEREFELKFRTGPPVEDLEQNLEWPFLIQTNVTRFGPLLLVLFFVGILVNLYRYNMRLSAYYDARADALELLGMDINGPLFSQFVSAVSPERYDFGKAPRSPADEAVRLAKTMADGAKP